MGFTGRTTDHGEVLAGDMHQPAVDASSSGDNAIGRHFLVRHAKVGAAVLCKKSRFLKTVLIKEGADAFTCAETACLVLAVEPLLPATQL